MFIIDALQDFAARKKKHFSIGFFSLVMLVVSGLLLLNKLEKVCVERAEVWIGQQIGKSVSISHVKLEWHWVWFDIVFYNIRVADPAVTISELGFRLDLLKSLLAETPIIDSMHLLGATASIDVSELNQMLFMKKLRIALKSLQMSQGNIEVQHLNLWAHCSGLNVFSFPAFGQLRQSAWGSLSFSNLQIPETRRTPALTAHAGSLKFWGSQLVGQSTVNLKLNLDRPQITWENYKFVHLWHNLQVILNVQYGANGLRMTIPILKLSDDWSHWLGSWSSIQLANQPLQFWEADTQFTLSDLRHIKDYLPQQGVLSPGLNKWLSQAFLSGRITQGHFSARVWALPNPADVQCIRWDYDRKIRIALARLGLSSQWNAQLEMDHVGLRYAEGWPKITNMQGTLQLQDHHLLWDAVQGNVLGQPLSAIRAEIRDLEWPKLKVSWWMLLPLQTVRNFLIESPLSLKDVLLPWQVRGSLAGATQLTYSFIDKGVTSLIGHYYLQNGQVRSQENTWGNWSQLEGHWQLNRGIASSKDLSGMWQDKPFKAIFKARILGHTQELVSVPQTQLVAHFSLPAWEGKLPVVTDSLFPFPFTFRVEKTANQTQLLFSYRDQLTVSASQDQKRWVLNFFGAVAVGEAIIPKKKSETWQVHWQKMAFPAGIGSGTGHFSIDMVERIPPLTLECDACSYGNWTLGMLAFSMHHEKENLMIPSLSIQRPEGRIDAAGSWLKQGKFGVSSWKGQIQIQNFGRWLRRWHITKAVKEGKGDITFDLHWPGAPLSNHFEQWEGEVIFHLKDGFFSQLSGEANAVLGFGRIMSILTLQSVPLSFSSALHSFSDKGFDFSELKGKLLLHDGIATFEDVEINGSVAWVKVRGFLNLREHLYHLQMEVSPNVTGSLPVIIGVTGGPLAGAVAWVINKILARPIGQAISHTYLITGDWNHPKIHSH